MSTSSLVPPGFRFHPTDAELVDYYLRKKVAARRIDLDVIKDIDLYKIEPWDLQEYCRIGMEEEKEWYFFSHKDKKYPTGTRTNRATTTGFWKATGRDKPIYSKYKLVGMRKTLVFYKGRAPNGRKSDWIMHEYRLESSENGTPLQEEGWVVCRVFKKRETNQMKRTEHESCWFQEHASFMPDCDLFHQLSQLESSKVFSYNASFESSLGTPTIPIDEEIQNSQDQVQMISGYDHNNIISDQITGQVMDWRILDKFVATQLSQEHMSSKHLTHPDAHDNFLVPEMKEEGVMDCALASKSGFQIGL